MTTNDPIKADARVQAVIKRLSETERDLLLSHLSENWSDVPRVFHEPNAMRGWASKKIGLLESRIDRHSYKVRLSPFGIAVRDAIASEAP